jgi:hypothetical protein
VAYKIVLDIHQKYLDNNFAHSLKTAKKYLIPAQILLYRLVQRSPDQQSLISRVNKMAGHFKEEGKNSGVFGEVLIKKDAADYILHYKNKLILLSSLHHH